MANKLYGSHYINQQRSSGYKSTTYAMAEIVDNSVDAGATEIKIVLTEEEKFSGSRSRPVLNKIFFMDNGSGISVDRLNNCLTFSEGDGRSNKRIGAFGVGLPNSSLATCKRVEVFSRTKKSNWHYVFLDVDDQLKRTAPGYDDAVEKKPNLWFLKDIPSEINTIVVWSKLDKVDVSRAQTLINRSEKLLGRIYRYQLDTKLRISFEAYLEGKTSSIITDHKILPYDPLFVSKKETSISKLVWDCADKTHRDAKAKDPDLGHLQEFQSWFYYQKFIAGCKKYATLPLFQKYDDYWDVPYKISLNGKTYTWRIKASFAYKDIANPGIRSGGGTALGKEFGKKMNGDSHFKSANIFFLRANREIDFGSFGLYTVTDEKNRFWTIEIHFDSDLDELMGLSNNKQSTQFKFIQDSELDRVYENEDLPIGVQRERLYAQISGVISRCIKQMRKDLSSYAREFKNFKKQYEDKEDDKKPIPPAEPQVINVIPKGKPWTKEEIEETTSFLKSKYMNLSIEDIETQVKQFADGLTRSIVLYAPNQTGNLFEQTEKRSKLITLINTDHIYYRNILEPLKSHKALKIFAVSIEMLISSFALELYSLSHDDERYEMLLERFLTLVSSRLTEFIYESNVEIDSNLIEDKIIQNSENDFS